MSPAAECRVGRLAALSRNPPSGIRPSFQIPFPNIHRGRPFRLIQPQAHVSMKARMRPFGDARHPAVLDWIEVNVVEVGIEIPLIPIASSRTAVARNTSSCFICRG